MKGAKTHLVITAIHEAGHALQTTINDAFLTIAGPCAEAKFLGTPIRSLGCQSDYEHCIAIFERLKSLAQYAAQYGDIQCPEPIQLMNSTRSRARRWVASPNNWRAINCIARTLYEHGEIDAEALQQAIGDSMVLGISPQLNLKESEG